MYAGPHLAALRGRYIEDVRVLVSRPAHRGVESGKRCNQLSVRLCGNLVTRTAPGVTRTTAYDGLNRPVSHSYSDATPAVGFVYDTTVTAQRPANCVANSAKGRLSSVVNNHSATYYFYNHLGQMECTRQKTNGQDYDFRYAVTPEGEWKQMVYPYGRVVSTTFDDARRPASMTTTANQPNYADSLQYTAFGAARRMRFGNFLWETYGFNSSLQLTQVKLGATEGTSTVWSLQNTFAASGNNGNVLRQDETAGSWTSATVYQHDSLNRLVLANENGNFATPGCPDDSSRWCQQFGYDNRGNRRVTGATRTGAPLEEPTSFDGNNRITSANWEYDSAGRGNIAKNPMNRTFAYDGEDRQRWVCSNGAQCPPTGGNAGTEYRYDGEGRRVMRVDHNASPGVVTVFVYDAKGWLAGEYGATVGVVGRTYVTGDHLGSTRVVTDSTGGVVARHDYEPFGVEIGATVANGRSGVFGYGADLPKIRFTGKERDGETGLAYFGARYFSGAQGRFTSPDWSEKPQPIPYADLSNPQTLNLYSYVINNPLNRIDPLGHNWFQIDGHWEWHKGKTYTRTDSQGNQQTFKSKYTGLLVATRTGTNAQGAAAYNVTLYDQHKVVGTGTAFSGGQGHKSIKDGNYQILTEHDPTKTDNSVAQAIRTTTRRTATRRNRLIGR